MKEFKNILLRHILSAFLVTLILIGLQPFGLNEAIHGKVYLVLLYGFGTYLSCIIGDIIATFLLKMPYKENLDFSYMNKRRLIENACIIPIMGTIIFLSSERNEALYYLTCCAYALGISVVLYLIWIYKARGIVLRLQLEDAIRLNAILGERERVSSKPAVKDLPAKVFTIMGRGKDTVSFDESTLIFLESDGNYIHVHVEKGGKDEVAMVRCTMKQAEYALGESTVIVRCHKSFMVNTSCVSSVEGNSKGLILSLKNSSSKIPVSRTYVESIRSIIVG